MTDPTTPGVPDPGEPTPLPDPGEPTPVPDPGEPTPMPGPDEPLPPLPGPAEGALPRDAHS